MKHPWDRRLGFWWIAEDHSEHPAIVASPSGPRSYGELASGAHQLVHALRARGLAPGDAVAVMAPNGPDCVVWWLAVTRIGGVMVPLNTFYKPRELGYVLRHSDASALITVALKRV